MNVTDNVGALRVGDWKIVKTLKKKESTFELFNLKDDRSEKNDLSKSNTAKLDELKQRLAVYEEAAVPSKNKPMAKGFKTPKVWGER